MTIISAMLAAAATTTGETAQCLTRGYRIFQILFMKNLVKAQTQTGRRTMIESKADALAEVGRLAQENERLRAETGNFSGVLERAAIMKKLRQRCERTESEVDRLRAEAKKIKCPDNPGGVHRWDGDGQCLDCCNYATDLIDSVSGNQK